MVKKIKNEYAEWLSKIDKNFDSVADIGLIGHSIDKLKFCGDFKKNGKWMLQQYINSVSYLINHQYEIETNTVVRKVKKNVNGEKKEFEQTFITEKIVGVKKDFKDFTHDIKITKNNGSNIEGKIFGFRDEVWFKVNNKMHFPNKPEFEIEFNPNNLFAEEIEYLKEHIMALLRDIRCTRIDHAFDFNYDLSKFYHITPHDKSGTYSNVGKKETFIFGSRESEQYVVIYNKKEQLKKETRLTQDDIEKNEKYDVLWRYEIRLKGDRAKNNAFGSDNIFKGMSMLLPNWRLLAEKLPLVAPVIKLELEEPGYISSSSMDKNTKSKYRKYLKSCADTDYIQVMLNHWEEIRETRLKEFVSYMRNIFALPWEAIDTPEIREFKLFQELDEENIKTVKEKKEVKTEKKYSPEALNFIESMEKDDVLN